MPMKTIGCRSLVFLTQRVKKSSASARTMPRQLIAPSHENFISRDLPADALVIPAITWSITPAQAAPMRPVEAGRSP